MKFHGAFFKRPTSKIRQAKIYFILNSSPKIPKGVQPKSAKCASTEISNQSFCYWNIRVLSVGLDKTQIVEYIK